jgi:general secretion pathway protein D
MDGSGLRAGNGVKNRVKNRVENAVAGRQCCPQWLGMGSKPAKTLGSSMKIRAVVPAGSGSVVSRAAFRIALFAVLAVFGWSCVSFCADSAGALFKRGESAEAREDYDAAFNYYQQAYAKNAKDLQYRAAFYRVRVSASGLHITKGRKLLAAGDETGALVEFLRAAEIDPGNDAAQQEIARVRAKTHEAAPLAETSLPEEEGKQEEIDSMGAPAALRPVSNEPLTLHMTEDAKVVYQAVGKAAGINVLFDPDFNSKRIQVDLNNVSLLDALRIVGTISSTFWRPVTSNTIFVAANTRAKRTELDEQAVETFYLTNAWQQNDLNDVQTALRNVLPNAKVYGVASQNAIVMRATLDKARPEVIVDIAVLEVNKNWEKNLGLSWPSSVGASIVPYTSTSSTSTTTDTTSTTSTAANPTLYNLAHLQANDISMTIGAATANALLSDSNTRILDSPRIRCTDSQKATMKIGERIPIATGSYGGGGLGGVGGAGGLGIGVQTQFQYLDVGINIELTPTVHFDHDVTLKIKIEDSSENGSSTISGVTEPIIAQKTSEQTIRLREGEASVMSGMMNKTDIQSWSGLPGLSSIPGIKYLFGSKDHQIQEDEIIFLLIPHIVRSQELDPVNLRTIDTGVGQAIELRHVSGESAAPAPAPPPVRPVPTPQSSMGTVPGQTAQAAAPAALAQLREAAETGGGAPAANAQLSAPAPAPPLPRQDGRVMLALTPPAAPVAPGATFKVPLMLSGGIDIAAVPVQIKYDPAHLSLVNIESGDFLSRDGQAVALVHRDDGPGLITLNASRPPGAKGVSGAGVVCVLSFQAKVAGDSILAITHPGALSSSQSQVPAQGAAASIMVR